MDFKKAYEEKLRDPRWQRRRLEIMKANDFACELCGDKKEHLNVHHIGYSADKEPWEYTNGELKCLCDTCHKLNHMDQDKVSNYARKKLLLKVETRYLWETPFFSAKTLRDFVKRHCPSKSKEFEDVEFELKCELRDEYSKWRRHVKERLDAFSNEMMKTLKFR